MVYNLDYLIPNKFNLKAHGFIFIFIFFQNRVCEVTKQYWA